jgi:hypothetical protein
MKKLILSLLVTAFAATQSFAQVTIMHDTVVYNGFPKDGYVHSLKDSIVNNSAGPAVITWNKSAELLGTGWTGLGICDPVMCYSYDNAQHDFTLAPGAKGVMYVDMKAIPTAADGNQYVTITTNYGPMTFVYKTWATQVKDFENNNIVTVYPNPASSFINITINDKKVASMNVMNVVGRRVAKFDIDATTPNPIRVPLDNVADGVYLLQFSDVNGKILGVRRVTKN